MNKAVFTKIFIAILLIAIVILGFKATDQQNQLQKYELERLEVNNLLAGNDAAPGYSCGVLTLQRAKELLGNNPKLKRSFGQGPADTVQATKAPQEKLFWSDNCRYEDDSNSSRYVEMFVTTFQTADDAVEAFPDFIQVVNDAVELPSANYGQQLLYDGGAYYLLRNNRVIQIAASDGLPQELDSFSSRVFNNIINNL